MHSCVLDVLQCHAMRYVSKIFVALYPVVNISLLALKNELLFVANGRGSAVNRALDGCIYPG